jgi:PBSX family phage terminase large subunit
MLRDATLRTFLEVSGEAVKQFNRNEMTAKMQNGSEILFRTASDPDRLRGPSVSWFFMDEAALCLHRAYEIMIGRLRQFGVFGYAWMATTPKGRNWVWQKFVQNMTAGRKMFKAVSSDNVYLDKAVLEAWQQSYTGDFAKQELEAEFVSFEGLIYPEFTPEKHGTTIIPNQFTQVIAGVDWGYVHAGVILVLGLDGDGRAWVIEEHYQRQRRIEEWVSVAKEVRQTWGIKTFFCDPSEPDYIKAFRDAGLPAQAADNSVNSGLQRVKNRLVVQKDGRPRLMVHRSCVWLESEFQAYQWAVNRFGQRDMPLKANDHTLDALRYAVMGLDAGQKPLSVEASRYA